MSITTPTTQVLADNLVAQIDASLEHTTPLLPRTFTRVLAKAQAGVLVLLYKYAGWMGLQAFVAHASMQETVILGKRIRPLVEWGRLIGAGDPNAATRAELLVTVTVQTQSGSLPAGSQLLYPATGVLYATVAAVSLNAPTVQVVARASSDQSGGDASGAIGNLQPSAVLQFANPIPNVARNAVVAAQQVTGAPAETEADYRARVLRRFRAKPQGGAYADYQQWGEEAAGILHVYPYAGAPGEIDVYVEATEASSGSPDGIPTVAQLNAVRALIELDESGLATRRAANAAVNVLPISRAVLDVLVTGLEVDNPSTAEAAIESALHEYFWTREPFIVGLSILPRLDRITLAAAGGVVDDVVAAAGGSVASVELRRNGQPLNALTLAKGEKAKLGVVSFET
jgi:uncharacterized phage protein gp47/JayE